MRVDWPSVRAEFPLLARPGLVYLDAASTTPKPRRVLEAIRRYHEQYTANVARGVHALATEASAAYEAVRHLAAAHVGASPGELVFTHGTTDGINLVAASLGLGPDDEVVLSSAEHHSNTLPWRARATCKVLPARADGTPEFAALEGLLGPRTRAVALHHVSNVLGTIAPVAEIARLTRARGIPLLVDGAQAAGHLPVDVAALGCDFYAFSGHKLGGPTGVGVLYAREAWLERLVPYQWGGGMVARVDLDELELRGTPHRFEAGTPNVEGVLGMGAALELLREVGMEAVEAHGRALATRLLRRCGALPGVRVLGALDTPRAPLVALALPAGGLDAETVARTLSDVHGVMLSAGRHCAHPLHQALGVSATLRASAWLCSDEADIDTFADALAELLS